jgi:hypothetical protein
MKTETRELIIKLVAGVVCSAWIALVIAALVSPTKPTSTHEQISSEPVKELTPKVAEKVAKKQLEPVKAATPEPIKAPSQCEIDIKAAWEINKNVTAVDHLNGLAGNTDPHDNIVPAFKSCHDINQFVDIVERYPEATFKVNPKTYLANMCTYSKKSTMGICNEVPDYPGMKTTHYLAPQEFSNDETPVSDKGTMAALVDAFVNDRGLEFMLQNRSSILLVKDEEVDVLDRDGVLAQVRLHTTEDFRGNDIPKGKVVWALAKTVRTSYQYVK